VPYPFTAQYGEGGFGLGPEHGRRYYGPSLTPPQDQPPLWTSESPRDFYQDTYGSSGFLYAGIGAASLTALGHLPVNFSTGVRPGPWKGIPPRAWAPGRMFDWYAAAARTVEEYSPAKIFRTFQISPFLSQFETPVRQGFTITPAQLEGNFVQQQYLANLIGPGRAGPDGGSVLGRVAREGVRLEGGKLYFAKSGELALEHASAMRVVPEAHSRLGAMWARIVGLSDTEATDLARWFSRAHPDPADITVQNPLVGGMPTQIIGARSRADFVWKSARAWGGEFIDRFNRLLEAPFSMEPFETVFGGFQKFVKRKTAELGFKGGDGYTLQLAVGRGTGLRMLGSLGLKYGAIVPAAAMGYKTLDWLAKESETLDDTIFEEGLTYAGATVAVKANLLASQVAYGLGLNKYRELQEEIAPGSTSLQKLAAFPLMGGLAGVGVAYGIKIGAPPGLLSALPEGGMLSRQIFLGESAGVAREVVEEQIKQFGKGEGVFGFVGRLGKKLTTEGGIYSQEGFLGNVWRRIAEPHVSRTGDLSFKLLGKVGPAKLFGVAGALAGTALIAPFLPGALIPEKSPDELRALYSGETEVPIRRGRWWEFGRSPYEGRRVSYFRPHWYARMRMDARDESIWGDEASELSPVEKWLKSEFTYDLEKKHYRSRPYPVSGLPFEDVPFIGPFLAGTIGRLIKPPVLMHTEEWMGEKGVLAEPPRFGQRVATEVGETPGGMPETPYGIRGIVGEQIYRLQELGGLYGFSMMTMQEKLKGTPDIFDQFKQLESSRRMYGFERQYWDLELGGMLGTTEAFRRLYPHRRRQIPLYNPIRNLMPEWLPGPGDKSPDFLHGDPFTKVAEGELRLPGRGYAQRFPELEDVSPEDYPLIHRFKILADVAPYSSRFGEHLSMVRRARKQAAWDSTQEKIYNQTLEQLKERKKGQEFEEYKYLNNMGEIFGEDIYWSGEDSAGLLTQLNKLKAQKQEDQGGIFTRLFGGYWELLSHNAETALDQVTPVSPGSKLVHVRSPIEAYERLQLYGTENAFWNHPVRDFFRPTFWLGARAAGYEDVPEHIEMRREIEATFDRLKYVKFARLSNIARLEKDWTAVKEFEAKKDQTMFGLDPYTRNYTSIFRALPRRDRDYFNAFSEAETEEERHRILEIVPENERSLYVARWKMMFANEVRAAKKAGVLSEKQIEQADVRLAQIYDDADREGLPASKDLLAEYLETRYPGESYADWYRRVKLLGGLESIPGPDWVGWHPSVDLEDIKLKMVMNLGEDMHDYDLWPSRAQTLMNKPYINNEAVTALTEPEELSRSEIHDRINKLLLVEKMQPSVFSRAVYGPETDNSVDFEIVQERPARKGSLY